MALKVYKPISPGARGLVLVSHSTLWKGNPLKGLTHGKSATGGRGVRGSITVWHRGGGHKKLYRLIDFSRNKVGIEAVVERIEYDPNRSAFIALVKYVDGEFSYIIAPQRLEVGDKIISAEKTDVKVGNCMKMINTPVGTVVHNIEFRIGKGAQFARAAGSYGQIVGRDSGKVIVKLSSGEVRLIDGACRATVGAVSNPDQKNTNLGKAGRSRWLGWRPTNRGSAMNPIDHPHGGGEGKTKSGRQPVTPWGKPTKGYKTRRKAKPSDKFILTKRKK
ncbi:MAG: 50S ribosomal protein L2 [Holosporaceae bacterium]|jgi:large subunit ribosomal protein L2|nr:50S ribosomal protein L2 [Holosporaceae bacterium]